MAKHVQLVAECNGVLDDAPIASGDREIQIQIVGDLTDTP